VAGSFCRGSSGQLQSLEDNPMKCTESRRRSRGAGGLRAVAHHLRVAAGLAGFDRDTAYTLLEELAVCRTAEGVSSEAQQQQQQ
jgi:hypothetical protein